MAKAKEIDGLDCGASVSQGAMLVLRTRLEEMCALRAAALDWSDVEGVHDMRVASRRLRSAMRDFTPYLRKSKLSRSGKALKRVARALGTVRDQDVAIMALDELKRDASEEVAAGIERLVAECEAERDKARAVLAEAISEGKIAKLQGEFIYALEHATKLQRQRKKRSADVDGQSTVGTSFRQAGRDIIAASFEELRKLSASLYQPSRTRPLHRMRIAAKRLRYLVELYTQCWGEQLTSFAAEIAEMQSHLGELHDCDEWIAVLSARLRALPSESSATDAEAGTEGIITERRSSVWLLGHFVKTRTKHYRAALALWDEWEQKSFAANLMASLDEGSESIDLAPLTLSASEAVASDLQSA